MKKTILCCTLCALMSWPIAGHAQNENSSKTDSKEVCNAKNYNETNQAKQAEKVCRDHDTSGLNKKVEEKVNKATRQSSSQEKNNNGSSNGTSSNKGSGSGSSNSSSGSSSNNGSSTSSSGNTTSKCTSCTKQADALKNSRKQ